MAQRTYAAPLTACRRAETSARAIEDAFKDFTNREDVAVVLINQYVRRVCGAQLCTSHASQIADMIRHLVDGYTKVHPRLGWAFVKPL